MGSPAAGASSAASSRRRTFGGVRGLLRVAGRGFTLIELAVAMGIIAVLLGLTLTVVARARQNAQEAGCLSNLQRVGQAFIAYAMDSGGRFPDPLRSGQRWEDVLARYVPGKSVFRCEADDELYAAFSSSYDWRDTGDSATTLAGRRLTEVKRQRAVLAFESLPGWHAHKKMNAIRIDLSAETFDEAACLLDLTLPLDVVDALLPISQVDLPLADGSRDPM